MTQHRDGSPSKFELTRVRKARLATFFGFFQLGAMILVWSTSTTSLRHHLGWEGDSGDASFGMLALSIGIGATVGCFLIGPFLDRYGPRVTTTITLVLYPLAYVPLAFVNGIIAAVIIGALMGLLRGAGDTAVNAHGVQVERFYGRSIMSAFHAAYPAGGFVFGLISSAFVRHFSESPAAAYLVLGGLMSILGLLFGKWMLAKDELLPAAVEEPGEEVDSDRKQTTTDSSNAGRTKTTVVIMLGFGILLLGSQLSEGSLLDWGQEFVRRHAGTTASFAASAVTVYSGAQFIGRLFGDRLAEFFGARVIVGASGGIGCAGALLAMLGGTPTLAIVGFALLGLGLSAMAPLMLSAAGRRDPANAGRNIGIVNALGYGGMLVGPAAITVVVEAFGIDRMPALPAALLLLIAIFGPVLMRTVPRYKKEGTLRKEQPA